MTCEPASGGLFAIATTEVSCSAQDAAGNEAEDTFAVEVVDSIAPVVSVPASFEVEATGPEGAPVTYRAGGRDRADRSLAVRCAPALATSFRSARRRSSAPHEIAAGNLSRRSFTVTVVDSTPPALALPEAVAVEAGAPVAYSASARDAVDGATAADCSVPSGRILRSGRPRSSARARTPRATSRGRASSCGSATRPRPTLRLPDDLTVEATGQRTRVTYQASARERGGRTLVVRCRPATGSRFRARQDDRALLRDRRAGERRPWDVRGGRRRHDGAPCLVVPGGADGRGDRRGGREGRIRGQGERSASNGAQRDAARPRSGSTFPLGATHGPLHRARRAAETARTASFP